MHICYLDEAGCTGALPSADSSIQPYKRVGDQLAQEFGRGFEAKNLRRMLQFAMAFPDTEKVASLMRHLSWTHFLQLLPVKTDAARWFYAQQSMESRWSVRELHHQIERKAFERTELASLQTPSPVRTEPVEASHTTPALVFKDLYFLQPSRQTAQPQCQPIGDSVLREVRVYNAQPSAQSQRS